MAFDGFRTATFPAPRAFVIRLAEPGDLAGVMALAELTGRGFTSLPADVIKLRALLDNTMAAARGETGTILLVLVERATGTIAGCAAVKRGGEKRPGFANFRITKDATGVVRSLCVTDAYNTLTEIGGLFVHPDFRAKGVGKSLAQSRYMYLATAPQSFGKKVFAELRGAIDENGDSAFYDAACKSWLGMEFSEADTLCAAGANGDLVARLPHAPLSTKAFPENAMKTIGDCHDSGRAARAMLEKEGFQFEGVVDLLDGGALLVADTCSLKSLRESRLARVTPTGSYPMTTSLLFSTTQPGSFRSIAGRGAIANDCVFCDDDICEALAVEAGAVVRISVLSSRAAADAEQFRSFATTTR